MARKFITPVQDASLYQEFPFRNTGFDEILEVGKSNGSSSEASSSIRTLIQFDTGTLTSVDPGAQFFLNLRIANAENFQRNQTLEFWTVSESWDEGTGFFYQDLTNAEDGATWAIKDTANVTWSLEGGTTASLFTTFSFGWMPTDIRLDITTLVQSWISGTLNNGLLIKLPSTDEQSTKVRTNLKFFSRNTHTIYPPTLEAVWNSQVFNTSGNCGLKLAGDEFEVLLPDMRKSYVTGSTNRIRVNARAIQPIKSFTDRFRFANDFILQSGSMYGIVDEANNDVVIPFDSGSLLSADKTGSYFDLKIENMYINRTYKVMLQVPKSWGSETVDTGHRFKVV